MTTTGKKSNFENSNSISTDLRTAIIQEVQIRPPLWDENDCHCRNQELVNALWEEIGMIVGRPGSVVKTKWELLREKYQSEVTKEIASARKDVQYKSKWMFYDLMKFVEYGYDHDYNERVSNRKEELPPLESKEELCDICKHCVNKLLVVDEKPTTSANLFPRGFIQDESVPEDCDLEEVPSIFDYENYLPNVEDITISVEQARAPGKHDLQPVFTPKRPSGAKTKNDAKQIPVTLATTSSDQIVHPIPKERKPKLITPTASTDNVKKKDSKKDPKKVKEVEKVEKAEAVADYQEFRDSEMKRNPNYQFLMSLLPYLDDLGHVECLEVRAKIQCIVNDAYKKCRTPSTPSYYSRY